MPEVLKTNDIVPKTMTVVTHFAFFTCKKSDADRCRKEI